MLELRRDPPPADLLDYVLIFEKVRDVSEAARPSAATGAARPELP
jgi:hypothetical protein